MNTPLLNGNEQKYLNECIETGWISSEGPFVERFEQEFSAYVDRKFGVAVANGSAALDIAVQALGLAEGDEVIMPAFTIISPAFSVVRVGAVPVLVESDPLTFNMDVSLIEAKITPKTKAIIVVHIYGFPVDMDPVLELCEKHGLLLIEDAAEMHGQTYKGKKCGSFGDMSIFSFYPNKHITTGEGGMIVCNNEFFFNKCKKLRNLSFEPDKPRFIHYEMGWNYRMTNLQAAIGVAQLENIDYHIQKKREIGRAYQSNLAGLKGFQLPLEKTAYADNIYWVFALVAESESDCQQVCRKLAEKGIGTRPFFWPIHQQPVFNNKGMFKNESYPIAEKIARNGFYLPSGLGLSADDISTVCSVLKEIVQDTQ
ncbi:MAG: DegT/DnrJ/EryC1/StrS family aminotransferase [Pedobacter sp.]|nr:DegT/DnrJ/EryC1/StrS family aminotransferase [Pedobacter sp.]MDQ8052893.1 DegT/DnrJ/EryC1/StrS family aminotransferase [Pedobacter sp.]